MATNMRPLQRSSVRGFNVCLPAPRADKTLSNGAISVDRALNAKNSGASSGWRLYGGLHLGVTTLYNLKVRKPPTPPAVDRALNAKNVVPQVGGDSVAASISVS